jgi:hypothetical protein
MSRRHQCPSCFGTRAYSFRFDAFYCERCDRWLEEACEDKRCIFCAERPELPSMRQQAGPVRVARTDKR